jgi:predicted GIY-YIG superfamily endonuclease
MAKTAGKQITYDFIMRYGLVKFRPSVRFVQSFTQHHFCYVYILQSLRFPEQIYIGSTTDLKTRVQEHNCSKTISPRRYAPWVLYYYEAYPQEDLARLRERRLKQSGNAILELKKRIGLITI